MKANKNKYFLLAAYYAGFEFPYAVKTADSFTPRKGTLFCTLRNRREMVHLMQVEFAKDAICEQLTAIAEGVHRSSIRGKQITRKTYVHLIKTQQATQIILHRKSKKK